MLRNKTIALLTLFLAANAAHAAFQVGMSEPQIEKEIQKQLNPTDSEHRSLKQIIADAYNAQLDMGVVTSILVKSGADSEAVVNEVIRVGISPELVVSAAVRAGANRDAMIKLAIAAGADPASLTTATAAGRKREKGRSGFAPPLSPASGGSEAGNSVIAK